MISLHSSLEFTLRLSGASGPRNCLHVNSTSLSQRVSAVCVCVTRLKRRKTSIGCHFMFSFYRNHAGGTRPSCKRMPTKLCMMVEARADHPGVPATYLFLRWDEAKPKNLHADFLVLYFDTSCWTTCTVFAI